MRVLIIGNNTKYAKIFSYISEDVFILLDTNFALDDNRVSSELNQFKLISYDKSCPTHKIKTIKKAIIENNIDVVFTNRKDDIIYAYKATKQINTKITKLVTFHNSFSWINKFKVFILTKMIEKYSDGNIALSKLAYNQLITKKKLKNRTLYLPNTISLDGIAQKDNYDIDTQNIKICFSGLLTKQKNQLFIVKHLIKFCNDNPSYNVSLDLYGLVVDQKIQSEIIALSKNIKNLTIKLVGMIALDKIKEVISTYDLYISASILEMSPYNILEAQAAGLPILASNVSGHNDLIVDRLNGCLFNGDDEFDASFKELINNQSLREKIGKESIRILKEERSPQMYSNILKEFIDKVRK